MILYLPLYVVTEKQSEGFFLEDIFQSCIRLKYTYGKINSLPT